MLAIVKENILCFMSTVEQFSVILALLTLHAVLVLLCKHTYEFEPLRLLMESVSIKYPILGTNRKDVSSLVFICFPDAFLVT